MWLSLWISADTGFGNRFGLITVHPSILTQIGQELNCDPVVVEAILKSNCWGEGWSDRGDPIIFISAIKFNQITQRQYEYRIPPTWLKSVRTWHDEDAVVRITENWHYFEAQSVQWSRFCRLSNLDFKAAVASTEFGCYFLSGEEHRECGYETPEDFFLGC